MERWVASLAIHLATGHGEQMTEMVPMTTFAQRFLPAQFWLSASAHRAVGWPAGRSTASTKLTRRMDRGNDWCPSFSSYNAQRRARGKSLRHFDLLARSFASALTCTCQYVAEWFFARMRVWQPDLIRHKAVRLAWKSYRAASTVVQTVYLARKKRAVSMLFSLVQHNIMNDVVSPDTIVARLTAGSNWSQGSTAVLKDLMLLP